MAALVVGVVLAFSVCLAGGQAAFALAAPTVAEPTLPEPVATYISTGLLPRLAELYGPGKKAGSGIEFDSSAKVGDIHRLFAWTPAFLAGKKTDTPTELTNNWVAPITVKGQVIGLATVWINPSSDQPELANFDLGPGLATALAAAPKATVLIRDDTHSAWFASDGTTITPLVSGASGIATAKTITAYRDSLPASAQSTPDAAGSSNGLAIAAIVLGVVVVLLALFVLLPLRRRRGVPAVVAVDEPAVVEPPDAPVAPPKKPAPRTPPSAKPAATRTPATPKAAAPKPATPRKPPTPKPKAD
jgi:hypothetical protein